MRLPKVKKFLQNNIVKCDESQINDETIECAICLENFTETDQINKLKCNDMHIFHHQCLLGWVEANDNCPMCRELILGPSNNNWNFLIEWFKIEIEKINKMF